MNFPVMAQKSWLWFSLLLLYLLLIFLVSHLTAGQLRVIPFQLWDKLAHFLEYFPVGFLVAGWLHAKWPQVPAQKRIFLVIAIVACLGALDEFHQSFVPGRQVSLGDGLADTLGAAAGAMVAGMVMKWFERSSTKLS